MANELPFALSLRTIDFSVEWFLKKLENDKRSVEIVDSEGEAERVDLAIVRTHVVVHKIDSKTRFPFAPIECRLASRRETAVHKEHEVFAEHTVFAEAFSLPLERFFCLHLSSEPSVDGVARGALR